MINHRISSNIPSFPFYERYVGKYNWCDDEDNDDDDDDDVDDNQHRYEFYFTLKRWVG